jgi:predicted dehydrogenase
VTVRIGVVGAGTVVVRGILPHLGQEDVHDRVRVTAVCDPADGRAEHVARRFGVSQAFTSIEQLLAEGDVDAVTIASPIGLHYEHGRAALAAGKHVHFNKTMTTTAAEATELIELARSRDLRIVASPGELVHPRNREIRERIAAGEIGRLCWALCGAAFGSYHEDEPERVEAGAPAVDPAWYFRRPGGGPLYDMAVYALHALTGVLGPARRVTALSGIRIPERAFAGRTVHTEADDNTLVLLDFGDALFALVSGTAAGKVRRDHGVTYYGTSGSIGDPESDGDPPDPALLPHVSAAHRDIPEQHVFEDVMQLVDWIALDTPSVATAEHARHVIEIIEAAYRAAETGETQPLATRF